LCKVVEEQRKYAAQKARNQRLLGLLREEEAAVRDQQERCSQMDKTWSRKYNQLKEENTIKSRPSRNLPERLKHESSSKTRSSYFDQHLFRIDSNTIAITSDGIAMLKKMNRPRNSQ